MPLTLRAWSRYVVPLTLLSALAFAPLVWLAFRAGAAPDLAKARAQVRFGWVLAAAAWACQLWLVAGVSPAVRGLVRGEPLSQLGAFACGLRGLARGLVPCLIAVIAVALGGLTLHRYGRLRERQDWIENLARDFAWIPDGRILLAALLMNDRECFARADFGAAAARALETV